MTGQIVGLGSYIDVTQLSVWMVLLQDNLGTNWSKFAAKFCDLQMPGPQIEPLVF